MRLSNCQAQFGSRKPRPPGRCCPARIIQTLQRIHLERCPIGIMHLQGSNDQIPRAPQETGSRLSRICNRSSGPFENRLRAASVCAGVGQKSGGGLPDAEEEMVNSRGSAACRQAWRYSAQPVRPCRSRPDRCAGWRESFLYIDLELLGQSIEPLTSACGAKTNRMSRPNLHPSGDEQAKKNQRGIERPCTACGAIGHRYHFQQLSAVHRIMFRCIFCVALDHNHFKELNRICKNYWQPFFSSRSAGKNIQTARSKGPTRTLPIEHLRFF